MDSIIDSNGADKGYKVAVLKRQDNRWLFWLMSAATAVGDVGCGQRSSGD